ncbi:hypothetical protein L1887_18663 [Cichorium endivia]|nr:hypothetical protein L1887_18663 [Cichorium endivia]
MNSSVDCFSSCSTTSPVVTETTWSTNANKTKMESKRAMRSRVFNAKQLEIDPSPELNSVRPKKITGSCSRKLDDNVSMKEQVDGSYLPAAEEGPNMLGISVDSHDSQQSLIIEDFEPFLDNEYRYVGDVDAQYRKWMTA